MRQFCSAFLWQTHNCIAKIRQSNCKHEVQTALLFTDCTSRQGIQTCQPIWYSRGSEVSQKLTQSHRGCNTQVVPKVQGPRNRDKQWTNHIHIPPLSCSPEYGGTLGWHVRGSNRRPWPDTPLTQALTLLSSEVTRVATYMPWPSCQAFMSTGRGTANLNFRVLRRHVTKLSRYRICRLSVARLL
jgi:hypothetical protein